MDIDERLHATCCLAVYNLPRHIWSSRSRLNELLNVFGTDVQRVEMADVPVTVGSSSDAGGNIVVFVRYESWANASAAKRFLERCVAVQSDEVSAFTETAAPIASLPVVTAWIRDDVKDDIMSDYGTSRKRQRETLGQKTVPSAGD